MAVSPVLTLAQQYQAQLARAERQATQRLIRSYLRSWRRLEAMLNALLLEIGTNTPTRGQLVRMARYKALMEQITAELAGLQALTGNEIEAAGALVSLGEQAARELIAMHFGSAEVAAMLNVLPTAAIQTLLGF